MMWGSKSSVAMFNDDAISLNTVERLLGLVIFEKSNVDLRWFLEAQVMMVWNAYNGILCCSISFINSISAISCELGGRLDLTMGGMVGGEFVMAGG